MAKLLLAAAALGSAVQAFAIDAAIAQPTDATRVYPAASLPEITQGPSMHELMRRADVLSVLVAPDNTCGYVSGLLDEAYTCVNQNGYCAFLTTAGVGAIACCSAGVGCGIRLDCMDYAQISFSSACNSGCMNDDYTVKCSNAATPYCGTIRFSSSITDYFCQTDSNSAPMNALTTWIGETDGRTFSELAVTLTSDFESTATTDGGSETTGTGGPASTGSSGSSSGSNNGNGSSSSNGSSGSSTNIGPIVGGAVGGAAVLALVGFGIWFMLRRSRKNKANAQSAPQQPYPPMQQNQPGQPGPESYNQSYAQQQPQPGPYPPQQQVSPQGYPPHAAYFPTQEKVAEQHVTPVYAQANTPVSQMTDNRLSMAAPTSPTSTINSFQPQHTGGYQQQVPNVPSTVHEAGGDAVGNYGPNSNHHGQFHELG